jgi:hypothetical protein
MTSLMKVKVNTIRDCDFQLKYLNLCDKDIWGFICSGQWSSCIQPCRFVDPEDGGRTPSETSENLLSYTASHPQIQNSSWSQPWEPQISQWYLISLDEVRITKLKMSITWKLFVSASVRTVYNDCGVRYFTEILWKNIWYGYKLRAVSLS